MAIDTELERKAIEALLDTEHGGSGVFLPNGEPAPREPLVERDMGIGSKIGGVLNGRTPSSPTQQQPNPFQDMIDRVIQGQPNTTDSNIQQGLQQMMKGLEVAKKLPKYATKELPQIQMDEGMVKNKAGQHVVYTDTRGLPTGGIGHLMSKEELQKYPVGTTIPDSVVQKWFEEDTAEHAKIVEKIAPDAPEEIKSILFNMAFNLGEDRLKKFKNTLKGVQEGDWGTVAKEMKDSDWYKQVGDRSKRLIKRVNIFGEVENTKEKTNDTA